VIMGSIVKSIGKAIGKIGKSIGKLVKKALPIILMAGVAYMGISAYGAMGSGLTGAAAASGATNFTAGMGKITAGIGNAWKGITGGLGNMFGGGQAMASATGGLSSAGTMAGANFSPTTGGDAIFTNASSTFNPNAGIQMMSGPNSAATLQGSGMSANSAIADAMKYQSDQMWKGTMLKAGGAALTAMFDESDDIAKRNLDITEDEFKRRHTYGGFAMDSGKPSDYAKAGEPGHNPTGFWGQIGAGPPKYGSNNGGPRQFAQAGLKTPNVNSPGLINSRQGQRQATGLLGQPNKSVA
jgi:hypothetical protein